MKFKALSSNLFFRAATTSNTSEINHHSFSIFFFWNNLYDKKNGDKMFILSLTDIVSHHKMNLFHILCFFFLFKFCSCRFANLCRIYTYYISHTKSTFYSDKIKTFESFHFDESYFDRDFMSHRTVLSKKTQI